MRRSAPFPRIPLLFALAALPLLVGCAEDMSFLAPRGAVAEAQREHLLEIGLLVCVVVVPALLLGPIMAWRYRYGGRARYAPRWDFSWPVEFAIWGVPVAITIALMVLLFRATYDLDPYAPVAVDAPPFRVQVVGYDWKWLFLYPEHGVATVGELAWPADRPLELELTSATVMQSFHVPQLGSQIYAMGGMRTELHLAADGPGTFGGQNTQYNGRGFWQQKFAARALDASDWSAWLEDVRLGGLPFDAAAIAALERAGTKQELAADLGADAGATPQVEAAPAGVIRFRDVPEGFFASVLERFGHSMPPFVAMAPGVEPRALAAAYCGELSPAAMAELVALSEALR